MTHTASNDIFGDDVMKDFEEGNNFEYFEYLFCQECSNDFFWPELLECVSYRGQESCSHTFFFNRHGVRVIGGKVLTRIPCLVEGEAARENCDICTPRTGPLKSIRKKENNRTRAKQTKKNEDDEIEVIKDMQFKSCNLISKSKLKHEDYKHNKKKSYQCESCVFSFALPFELRRHMYLQHEAGKTLCFEKNDAGVFECDQCEYSSPSLRSIKVHFYNQHVE